MTPDTVMTIAVQAMVLTFKLAAPVLLTGLTVGLIVGLFQAATQIQETTLSFIPKLFGMAFTAMAAGPWMLHSWLDFTRRLIEDLPILIQ